MENHFLRAEIAARARKKTTPRVIIAKLRTTNASLGIWKFLSKKNPITNRAEQTTKKIDAFEFFRIKAK